MHLWLFKHSHDKNPYPYMYFKFWVVVFFMTALHYMKVKAGQTVAITPCTCRFFFNSLTNK